MFKLGVIMLNTHFSRPIGDIGNPLSYQCPVEFCIAPKADVSAVVRSEQIVGSVVDDFAACAMQLAERGCSMITTSCGFACSIHEKLAARIPLPLVSSSLN